MNIKKIGIGIILLLGIYFGYQQYKNQQNIEVDFGEELVLLIEALNDLEEEFVEYLKANPEAEETLEAAEDDAAEAVSDVTPESGEVVFGLEDATGMGEVADIAVDAAVVSAAAE